MIVRCTGVAEMAKSIVKKGPPRKSRRQRLPISSAGAWPEFEPSATDWERILAAYPYLDADDRAQIVALANEYLKDEPFERNAPFLDDAMKWIRKTRKAAKEFHERLFEGGEAVRYARNYAGRNVNHHLFEPEGPMDWSGLSSFMTFLRSALLKAENEIPKEARVGFAEGEAWEKMVRKLSEYCKSRGYPTGASKGENMSAKHKTSPFVAFVREIQMTFPDECRRHTQSDAALAQGITEARRKRREAKSAKGGF